MAEKSLLLLDLEDTLINDWDDFTAVRVPQVRVFLDSHRWSAVGLFSFAVWDDRDLLRFHNHKQYLEEVFGFEFNNNFVWSVDQLKAWLARVTNKHFPRDDIVWNWSKEWTLLTLARDEFFHNRHVTLLDDEVRNMDVSLMDTNSRLTFVNVKTL